ncbi:MAG: OmpP1/FadL family transporter [Sandaracinaceae bacterium]
MIRPGAQPSEAPSIRSLALLSCLAILLLAPTAFAQAIGTPLSGPASADGVAAYYNPAAMGAGTGTLLELNGGVSVIQLAYAQEDGATSTQMPVGPLLSLGGYTDALHEQWRIGLAGGVSRASGGFWGRDDGAGNTTRYYMVTGQSFHIQLVPAVSFTPIEWLTIGVGANLTYGSAQTELDKDFGAQLNQTVGSTELDSPFPYASPDLAAPVFVSGDGFGVGATGGILVRPIPELSLAASIHSPVVLVASGSLRVEYPDALRQFVADTLPSAQLPDLNGSIEMQMDVPMQIFFGVSARPHPMVDLGVYYQFEHTSSQPNFNLTVTEATSESIENQSKPQAYVDRHRVHLRAGVLPIPELLVAAHFTFQSNTVPDETLAPNNMDFNRIELGLTARWQLIDEVSLLLSYGHTFLIDRDISTSLHRPVTQPSLAAFNHPSANGTYSGSADIVRLAVGVHF